MKESEWSGSIPSESPLYSGSSYLVAFRSVMGTNMFGYFQLGEANVSLTDITPFITGSDVQWVSYTPARAVIVLPTSCKYKPNGAPNEPSTAYDIVW